MLNKRRNGLLDLSIYSTPRAKQCLTKAFRITLTLLDEGNIIVNDDVNDMDG